MAVNLITSIISLGTKLLPTITASAQAPNYSSSSICNNSEKGNAGGAEEDLKSLMRTLKRIEDTLYDAQEREIRDRSVKHWLKELKKVAYDAEDVLSEYKYEVTSLKVEARKTSQASGSHKRKHMEYVVPIPDGMIDRLDKIRSRFDEIAKDRKALQLREGDGMRRLNRILQPPTGHMIDEASIFGRGAEIMEVVNFLLSEKEKSFSVISIVGKGGLGKTTIAQLVYKNLRDSQHFDFFGWVSVSQEFNVSRLIKATIQSVSTDTNYSLSELSPLQEELAEIVKEKSILLVLDDVWNENQSLWELFRVPFKAAKMVRVLVTTRNKKVAKVMQTTTCFSPANLPDDSCWQLFQHYAFSGKSDIMPTHLVDMGREIMRKCGGLPLAVKSIASLLRHEIDEESWKEILESDLWKSNPSNDIFPALQISYAHLPAHLKPCFLFSSMYPKDYKLQKMNLIELWISHGYIKSRGRRRMIEIGVEYYEELKERSFLDDFSSRFSECCKLHDIMHDLARLNSENEHYSVEINQRFDIHEGHIPQEAYHLYARGFMGYVNQILQQNLKGLRTLSTDLRGRSDIVICNLTKFETLRALELKGNFTEIPHSISQLKHLTYLSITSSTLQMLPLSIGLLYNLQTLILSCPFLKYLPSNTGDLANLQLLYIQGSKIKKLPKSLNSLSNLHRLFIRSNYLKEVPSDLKNLCNLHVLTIHSNHKLDYVPHDLINFPTLKMMTAWLSVRTISWLKDMKDLEGNLSIEGLEKTSNLVDAQYANLRNKCKLETLNLCWDSGNYEFPYDAKSELILSLKKGCESGFVVANDVDFSMLECLQPHSNLKKLRLRWYRSATVPGWMRDPFSLQSIQEVVLEFCHSIQSLPFGNLHTLKYLTILACDSIQVLQLEQLPSQLEKLHILVCGHLKLITGLRDMDMLAILKMCFCKALTSITMDELHMVESTQLCDSSHEKAYIGRQSIKSLTRLEIEHCPLLHDFPDGLIPYGPSYVRVRNCGRPDLEIGHMQ